MRLLTATLVSALLFSTASMAQNVINDDFSGFNASSGVEAAYDWSGIYAGVQAGYGFGKSSGSNGNSPVFDSNLKPSGFSGGIYGGYNYQFNGGVVIGAEADVNFGNMSDKGFSTLSFTDTSVVDDVTVENSIGYKYSTKSKIKTNGTMRARLGYGYDRFLPYLTGGVAWGNVKQSADFSSTLVRTITTVDENDETTSETIISTNNGSLDASKTQWGYAVGAGVEYAVLDDVTLRFEYLYTDLGKKRFDYTDGTNVFSDKFKTSFSTVRVGLAYKF